MNAELLQLLVKEALSSPGTDGESSALPFRVGEAWFCRTVTYHIVGRITEVIGQWLVMDDAAWVAESGRYADLVTKHVVNEVEPVGRCVVNATSVTDAFPWTGPLPLAQK